MTGNDSMNFHIGDLNITVSMENGEVTGITAEDENGYTWDVGFAMERLGNGSCLICRYMGGHKECWEVPCGVLEKPISATEKY